MPDFNYNGVNKDGQKIRGKLTCSSEGEARMLLRAQGIRPNQVVPVGILESDIGSLLRGGKNKPLDTAELVRFTNLLQVLVGSGVPIIQALDLVLSQTKDKGLRQTLVAVRERVGQGSSLSDSMLSLAGVFPRVYVALVKAGEATGSLEVMLGRLAQYFENLQKVQRTVRGALIYPAVLVLAGVGTVVLMLKTVIPQVASLLQSSGAELPALTKFVISASNFVQEYFFIMIFGAGAAVFLAAQFTKSPDGRRVFHLLLYRIPILGDALKKSAIARFTRTLGTLLTGGLPLIEALDVCRNSVDSAPLESAILRIRRDVETGKPMSLVVNHNKIFPSIVAQMIGVGETTGSLDKMLNRIADFYESEVDASVTLMTRMIEPILILFLGLIIGTVVLAMYQPLFEAGKGFK